VATVVGSHLSIRPICLTPPRLVLTADRQPTSEQTTNRLMLKLIRIMRQGHMRAAMMSLALLAGLVVPLGEAAGQSNCASKCKGNSACLNRCGNGAKHSPQAKHSQATPKATASPSSSQNGWRERAFTTEGGAGGY
jgi:hypothetical protein